MKQYAPATERNRTYIRDVLERVLPEEGIVLEVASGTGQHAVYFSQFLPSVTWQPSDPNPVALESIAAWKEEAGLSNLLDPVQLETTQEDWGISKVDALVCINMIHISPWKSCVALFEGASERLSEGGIVFLYGPFKKDGKHTAESNARFDESLRSRNPSWGVRDLSDVISLAESLGFLCSEVVDLPANNKSVVFVRR